MFLEEGVTFHVSEDFTDFGGGGIGFNAISSPGDDLDIGGGIAFRVIDAIKGRGIGVSTGGRGGDREGDTEDGASLGDTDIIWGNGELDSFFGGPIFGIFPHMIGVVLHSSYFLFLGDAGFTVIVLWFEHRDREFHFAGGTDFGLAEEGLVFFKFEDIAGLPGDFHAFDAFRFEARVEGGRVFYAAEIAFMGFGWRGHGGGR